jgi:hypothetical protein
LKNSLALPLKKGYTDDMAQRRHSKRPPADENVAAKWAVEKLTSEDKNPAAVALGKLGGLKGGPARAARLSSEQRSAIARLAAKTRWGKE